MAEWFVHLTGHIFDLQNLAEYPLSSDWQVVQRDAGYYLTSSAFATAQDAEQVKLAAAQLVPVINGLAMVRFSGFQPVASDDILCVNDDGTRHFFKYLSASVTCRSRATGTLTVSSSDTTSGNTATPAPIDPWIDMARLAEQNTEVAEVLERYGSRPHNWVEMYNIYEIIRRDAGGTDRALASLLAIPYDEIRRFTGSACSPQIAGKDARHGVTTNPPPNNPMQLTDAKAFIRDLITKWLHCKRTVVSGCNTRLDSAAEPFAGADA